MSDPPCHGSADAASRATESTAPSAISPPLARRPLLNAVATSPAPTTSRAAPRMPRAPMSQGVRFMSSTRMPTTISRPAIVTAGTGERGPAGGRATAATALPGAAAPTGSAGMSSQSRGETSTPQPPAKGRGTNPPEPPAKVRARKPTRQSSASMPLYSARPPQTPPSILSLRLRYSCWRGAGRSGGGGGGGGCQAGGSTGDAGGGADVMDSSLPSAGPADHQGTPGSDPGSSRSPF